jgi:hypothetical protein
VRLFIIAVLWEVTPRTLVDKHKISEEPAYSIFRIHFLFPENVSMKHAFCVTSLFLFGTFEKKLQNYS